jgi:hypothetical protein
MWILLALNGTVILCAGTAGAFLGEEGRPADADPVPTRRPGTSVPRASPPITTLPSTGLAVAYPPAFLRAPSDRAAAGRVVVAPARTAAVAPGPLLRPSVVGPTSAQDEARLHREMGLLELQGIASAAITTGEHLGGEELQALLEGSAVDLAHLSELLGATRRRNETPYDLLIRLLRLSQTIGGAGRGGATPADTEQLIVALNEMNSAESSRRRSRSPPTELGSASDQFDALLRELSPAVTAPKSNEVRDGPADP